MMSLEHHLVTYQWYWVFGWWHLHHNYVRVGGIKGWMHRRRSSQFWYFRCSTYRAKLIPSRVLWCAPTSGQSRILYLLTTKRCLVDWLLLIGIFLWSSLLFLLTSVVWVTIKPMVPAKRTRVPGGKDCHHLSELTESKGRGIREFLVAHPSQSEVVTYISILVRIIQLFLCNKYLLLILQFIFTVFLQFLRKTHICISNKI